MGHAPRWSRHYAARRGDDTARPLSTLIERAKARQLSLGALIQAAESLTGGDAVARAPNCTSLDRFQRHIRSRISPTSTTRSLCARSATSPARSTRSGRRQPTPSSLRPASISGRAFEDGGDIALGDRRMEGIRRSVFRRDARRIGYKLMALQNIGRCSKGGAIRGRRGGAAPGDRAAPGQDGGRPALDRLAAAAVQVADPATFGAMRRRSSCSPPCRPLSLAAYADDPMFQLAKAHAYNKTFVGRPDRGPVGPRAARKKVGTGKRLQDRLRLVRPARTRGRLRAQRSLRAARQVEARDLRLLLRRTARRRSDAGTFQGGGRSMARNRAR